MDMSAFDGMRMPEDAVPDPRALREQIEQQTAGVRELQERLKELVGRAESDDGLIVAVVADTGLKELRLDPKAMRKPSADLGPEIVEVTAAARQDYDVRRRELMAELRVGAPPVDPAAALGQIREMTEAFTRGASDVQALAERFLQQARAGGAAAPPRERG